MSAVVRKLVDGEVVAAAGRGLVVHRGDVDAVGELEGDRQQEPDQPRAAEVEREHRPPRVEQRAGSRTAQAEVGQLADDDLRR